jgi:hypothetical protein
MKSAPFALFARLSVLALWWCSDVSFGLFWYTAFVSVLDAFFAAAIGSGCTKLAAGAPHFVVVDVVVTTFFARETTSVPVRMLADCFGGDV